jgi:hypothetical protein
MQTRRHSLLESVTNVLVGYGVAIAAQVVVFPWFGMHPRLADNFAIGGVFTVVSLTRSYLLRRLFNLLTDRPR